MPDNQRGFNVGVWKAEISNRRVLRPNLFHVEFSIPPGLANGQDYAQNFKTAQTLEYWCEATMLPGFQLNTYQGLRFGYGTLETRPTMSLFGEIQFDFIFDSEASNYQFFFDWLNMIINSDMRNGPNDQNGVIVSQVGVIASSPFELAYKEDYTADVSILVYDQEGRRVKQLTLREAFPKMIGDIRLAWADNNTYMRLPVAFVYNDWFQNDDLFQEDLVPKPPTDYFNLK